ncbi:MAG: hypothetical protein RLZ98_2798 [Pseudomonadota bacterium]|jgi:hypothetical protein
MPRFLFAALALILTTAFPAAAFTTKEAPAELNWRELIPPEALVVPKARRSPFDLGRLEDPTKPVDLNAPPAPVPEGQWMSRPAASQARAPAKVVEALDGKLVRIGGYVVPLDFDATTVKEFLLVPFVGACIHVPPPPANQIIYVKSQDGFKLNGLFDPVYVTGTLRTKAAFTGLAQTGYSLDATKTEMRK